MRKFKCGLEIHATLENCESKIFCGCPTSSSKEPNTGTCPTCLGLPGSKPMLNREAIRQAIKAALALNCRINKQTFFSRKTYFYPDLAKNFQITQYEMPLAEDGMLDNIRIRRVHLEEDPASLVHKESFSLVDYNRSGMPLIEIVTEPDFKSPEEVRDFLNKITLILEYTGIYSRSSEYVLKCDVNVSIDGGERVEVKNINGIKEAEKAVDYEVERQKQEKAVRETRGWDEVKGISFSLRKKETEEDYGYIAEPDLTEIEITDEEIEAVKINLPELADEKVQRLVKEYEIDEDDAKVLSQEILLAELFEKVAKKIDSVLAARWLRRDLLKLTRLSKKGLHELEIDETHIIELLELVEKGKISDPMAKELLEKLINEPFSVKKYIKEKGLEAVSDRKTLEVFCKEAVNENPGVAEAYKGGKEEALNFLVGQVMKKSNGKAVPQEVKKIIIEMFQS